MVLSIHFMIVSSVDVLYARD